MDTQRSGKSDDAAKPLDAAVQRALVEAREEMLVFLQRRLRNRDDAEEVLQRFSLRALERASQLRDIRTVRGWLGRILATTLVDHQRNLSRRRRRETAVDDAEIESEPVDAELDAAVCNCLYRLLPTLKPEYSDIVWRADILGEPRDRLAASLGTSLNNVAVRLHRGRQALRKRLEEMCRTCPIHGFLDCHCEKAEKIRKAHEDVSR
ncbi:RNA polymerase sigma factor [Allorhizobium sp. NPDC080224]|uniref:RNA polymerase sigma-70 factor n=2 Tax=Rhizobium/Agrobacterium group TaxID=227290 RepID=A0A285U4G9_9HYPH|nr:MULTISPECIES: sigma factor-like helix-turn-helix DNA-binding protein [Rhizobium/Agrobacterium group]CAD6630752.1 RNA polymerase subunit sigma-70 [Pseudorhizobium flavum]SOC36732.1 RNA polymerase sigma-70 factor [Rhizobium subbaraonis]